MLQIYDLPLASETEAAAGQLVLDTGAATKRYPFSAIGTAAEINDLSRNLATLNGKDLGAIYTPAEFKAKILEGDFSGLNLGDYFDITLTTGEEIRVDFSAANPYLLFSDTALTENHCMMTFHDCLATTMQMNTTNTNTGGYAASLAPDKMDEIYAAFPSEWQAIIRSIPRLENNKGAWAWAQRKLFLLSETEVHGHPNWADGYDGGTRPIPLFQFSSRYRIKGLGKGASEGGSRYNWWLASPSGENATSFCSVSSNGCSGSYSASNSHGVAPGFCI